MDVLPSSSNFQVLQSLYQSFVDCTKSINYNWHNRHFYVSVFYFLSKVHVLNFLFTSFQFYSVVSKDSKVHNSAIFFLLLQDLVVWVRLDNTLLLMLLLLLLLLLLYTLLEFFTSASDDGFSLEFEWQQVSSSLQDSCQYSGCLQ